MRSLSVNELLPRAVQVLWLRARVVSNDNFGRDNDAVGGHMRLHLCHAGTGNRFRR